ncbi:hypothetical protein M5K25_000419 [Dendrobium thyrsiflorum]|uniref:Uncharacterized protein n=1 Tax=Dendrobium thyrsiflorum TaxID=117978 RepID=A0ABD0VU82_DENTH
MDLTLLRGLKFGLNGGKRIFFAFGLKEEGDLHLKLVRAFDLKRDRRQIVLNRSEGVETIFGEEEEAY